MDVDKIIKWATGLTVGAVAVFAAIISYTHLYELSNHQALLPLCVDGLMVAASLVLLAGSRAKLSALPLARVALWSGIAATVAGNLAYGLPQGWEAGFVSMWPAVCFVLTVETVMQLAKAKRIKGIKTNPVQTDQRTPKALKPNELHNESDRTDRVPALLEKGNYPPSMEALAATSFAVVVPGIKAIRGELGCGQPIAYEVQGIMREQNVDMHKALLIRNEARANATSD